MKFNDFKVGDYVKCVCPKMGEHLTLNKVYQILEISPHSLHDEFNEFLCANMIDDYGYPYSQIIYTRQYKTERKIIRKWYQLFIPKIEFVRGEILKEEIYFEKATELEFTAQNYNL